MEKLREGVVIDPAEVEAYLAHLRELGRTAGTLETGTVRASVSDFNTRGEAVRFLRMMESLCPRTR